MDTTKKIREQISALCDGELPDEDIELGLAGLRTAAGAQAWAAYHQIGDAVRALPAHALAPDFAARLAERLKTEAAPSAPLAAPAAAAAPAVPPVLAGGRDLS